MAHVLREEPFYIYTLRKMDVKLKYEDLVLPLNTRARYIYLRGPTRSEGFELPTRKLEGV